MSPRESGAAWLKKFQSQISNIFAPFKPLSEFEWLGQVVGGILNVKKSRHFSLSANTRQSGLFQWRKINNPLSWVGWFIISMREKVSRGGTREDFPSPPNMLLFKWDFTGWNISKMDYEFWLLYPSPTRQKKRYDGLIKNLNKWKKMYPGISH